MSDKVTIYRALLEEVLQIARDRTCDAKARYFVEYHGYERKHVLEQFDCEWK